MRGRIFDFICRNAINCETRVLCVMHQQLTGSSAVLVHGTALCLPSLGETDQYRARYLAPWRSGSNVCELVHAREAQAIIPMLVRMLNHSSVHLRKKQGIKQVHAYFLQVPGTGPAMPLSSLAPRSSSSKRLPSSLRVLSAMMTVFGSAIPCRRAASFGVSPTTSRT
jgi:hypothetical protein